MLTSADGLQKCGNDIFISGQPNSIFLEKARSEKFKTFPLKIKGDFNPVTVIRLAALIKQLQIDIIIANFNKDVRLGGLAKKIAGRGILVARNGLPILQDKLVYRLTYRYMADRILTNSVSIKDKYLQYGWLTDDFIKVIHNGIEIAGTHDESENLPGYNIPPGSKVVGFFGRFVGQKQPLSFLEIARNIKQKIPNILFIMVGEGPLRNKIEQQAKRYEISDHLILPGFQNTISPYLNACDLVLLTSYKEGLPNVIMEAMNAKKAVVAYDVGGVKELIPNDSIGCVVPVNESDSMSEQSIALLKNDNKRIQMGIDAHLYIVQNFSKEKMISELDGFLRSLV